MHLAEEQHDRSASHSSSSCVKIYLCSNPEDSVIERRSLRECVFPRLREHCRHTLGLDVRLIDPFESSDPRCWPDENTRQQLIEECRESSAGPFLLALVGHQYGSGGLPALVQVSEYQLLLQQSQQAGISTQELEGAYRRDENTVPASYCLRPSHRNTSSHQVEVHEEDESKRKAKEEELRTVFQTAVSLCVQRGLMTPQKAHSYYRSVLDADLHFALDSSPDEDIFGRCLVYVHKVVNAKGEREQRASQLQPQSEPRLSEESSLRTKPTDGELLSELCDSFLPGLISSCHLIVYTTTTECDRRHGYTTARRLVYAESLCQQVYSDLVALTDCSEQREDSHVCDASLREQTEQQQLCHSLSGFYDIIQPEEEKVRAFVEQRDQQCPLVVTGGPCTGKTVLMAHCTQQIKSWLAENNPVVISYFCSLSIITSPKRLLSSLCAQIACRYLSVSERDPSSDLDDPSGHNCGLTSALDPHDLSSTTKPPPDPRAPIKPYLCLSELKNRLSSLLNLLPSTKQPLILMLDGLDQLENNVGLQVIQSLPSPLPPNVKLILTVSTNRTLLLQTIKLHYPQCSLSRCVSEGSEKDTPGYVCVQLGSGERKQCVKMLASLLRSSARGVTSGQQALVNQALTSCCLPLYTRLLHAHTLLWRSDSDVTESSLPDGVHSSISALLDHLEHKHSSSFVFRAVSYLTLSRAGLSEAELADLLSTKDELVSQDKGTTTKINVPQVNVETLLLDLKSCLMRSTVAGSQVLLWVSRHFKLVVAKRYLGSQDVRRKIHSVMADYFSGNQQCSQPFVFFLSDVSQVNLRKLVELPYHLEQSGRCEELERRLLMSLEFHQAMVQAGLLGDLVAMLEADDVGSQFLKERFLMASMLKRSSCFLQSSPFQLPTVMEINLHLYQEVFPPLKAYMRDIRQERRRRGGGLGVALCPSPSSVSPIQCLKPDDTTEDVCVASGTERVVAEVMGDGSAWIWNGSGFDVVKLLLSCEEEEMKFTGVKSSGQFFLLSTECGKLFLWDVTGPEMFLEVKDTLKTKSQTSNKIEGFAACQEKLYVWWKDESFVSVFDISTETMTHFQCQSSVTCVVADAFFMYCGQDEGTVSVFDIQTNSLLYTCSNTNQSTVTSIILCKDRGEIACIDRNGNVAVWENVAEKTHPPRQVKEAFNEGRSDNTLSVDYCKDINTLLVCQANQVTLWDTCNWELWDQFMAPQGKAFTQAVLSQDGHLFTALLDTCTHVLVWRVGTGECVLSLEMNKQPHMLLKTVSDVICVTHDGCLTVWDSKMINVAGSASKMRRGVKEVLVEDSGKWFYTTDGSETVWRWSLDTGLPHANLLHDGPVEKLRLSPNSVHLVSLSAEQIYVWVTKSAANILRISGSRATDILITPNGNCGVSISDRGLSRVWKMTQGSIVCSIHVYLSDAQVSPENTFLIGLRSGDLLAASMWSGSISKRFSCVESSESVSAFHTLSEHPEFVVVMVASGAVYTWKVTEETVCRHFHLPHTFYCQPHDFQMSSNGSWALLSIDDDTIHLLDLSQVRLCSFRVDGPVLKACLDKAGRYIACVSSPESSCDCELHTKPALTVTRLSDGERVGSVCLSKTPLTLAVWGRHYVFVGFEDGSVGVYSLSDVMIGEADLIRCRENLKLKECPFDRAPSNWFPLEVHNVMWP